MIAITYGPHGDDEFGHDYVREYVVKQDGQEIDRLTLDIFVRHPAEDTSRTYTRQERIELGIGWRYFRLVTSDGRFIEHFAEPCSPPWVAEGRTWPTMREAVTAVLGL